MRFNEKLNLLMCLQNTPNNKLAKTLSVDPSLISRWRTGTRSIAKNSTYLKSISDYFAEHATDPQSLLEILGVDHVTHRNELSEHLWTWLSTDLAQEGELATAFISRLESTHMMKLPSSLKREDQDPSLGRKISIEAFHGNSGKRNSLIKFLNAILQAKTCCTLLMYSDESMTWMYEDPTFYVESGLLLAQVIQKGNRVKIIHTIDRNKDELKVAIDRWLPLYMTGAVEPYFYPGYQEHLLKRTMFIAPGIAALTSNALSNSTSSEQLLYQDLSMIEMLTAEFNDYLSICRPLIRIYNHRQAHEIRQLYEEFSNQPGDIFLIAKEPSQLSLYEETFTQIFSSKVDEAQWQTLKNTYQSLQTSLKKHSEDKFHEWCFLPDLETVDPKTFQMSASKDFFSLDELHYSFEDLVLHVGDLYQRLKEDKHFNLYTGALTSDLNSFICLKKNVGVIVIKSGTSPIYFAFNHPIMIHAFDHFIEDLTHVSFNDLHLKQQTLKHLEKWLHQARLLL